jgi:hypothetical protein
MIMYGVLVVCVVVVLVGWCLDVRAVRRLRRMEMRQEKRGVEHEGIEKTLVQLAAQLDRIEKAQANGSSDAIAAAFFQEMSGRLTGAYDQPGRCKRVVVSEPEVGSREDRPKDAPARM